MEKLTIQQKSRAYDEALHKAKRIINVCVDDNTECRSMIACIQQIFPELREEDDRKPNGGIVFEDFNEGDGFYKVNLAYLSKEQVEEIENIVKKWNPEPEESEDERIKKNLREFLLDAPAEDIVSHHLDTEETLAWLEKQGEPTDINPSEFDLRLNKLLKQFETLSKEELASSLSFYLNVVQNDGTYKAEEKQGEQKSVDKIEPKFKVGDWIVQENIGVYKVIEVCESWYEVIDIEDNHYSISFDKEYMCHLWTIQDAKTGDVLVCKGNIKYSNGVKYERICLFNNLDKAFFTLVKTSNYVETYDIDVNIDYPDNTVPATKEQREILFMAMANASYEWDAEKKELKKIEQKPAEWSEEDEDIRDTIIRDLKHLYL